MSRSVGSGHRCHIPDQSFGTIVLVRPNAFIVRVHVSRRLVHDGAARVVALIDVKLGSFSQRERGLFVKGDALSDCLRQASEDVDPMGP